MSAVAAARPGIFLVRRVITRQADAGGEDFEAVSEPEFARRQAAGDFLLSWQAHGLHYGIPQGLSARLDQGEDALVNLSRSVLQEAQAKFPGFRTLVLTAPVPVLAARLAARGRESAEEIEGRLARAGFALPDGIRADVVENAGALEDTVVQVLRRLDEAPVE